MDNWYWSLEDGVTYRLTLSELKLERSSSQCCLLSVFGVLHVTSTWSKQEFFKTGPTLKWPGELSENMNVCVSLTNLVGLGGSQLSVLTVEVSCLAGLSCSAFMVPSSRHSTVGSQPTRTESIRITDFLQNKLQRLPPSHYSVDAGWNGGLKLLTTSWPLLLVPSQILGVICTPR